MAKFNEIIASQEGKNNNKLVCTMPHCGKEFSSRFCLKRHFLTIHLGLKKFKCDICGRNFAQKQYLTEHINTHT